MQNVKKLIAAGTVIGLAFVLSACSAYRAPSSSSNSGGQTATQSPITGNVISYTSSGFSPAALKAKVGDTVTIKNDSGSAIQVNSAPHPVHTDFPELNVGPIAPEESKTVTFTTAGTKEYHNHLNPVQIGKVVVE